MNKRSFTLTSSLILITVLTILSIPLPTLELKKNISYPASLTTTTTTSTQKIVGYYAAWSAYTSYTPDKIDASKLTHIHYAFAKINQYNKIAMGYPDVDLENFSKLRALKKKKPSLKTLISVGGWTWSGRFSDIAATQSTRDTFANSIVSFITKYGFDGVDIDWEYPVSGGLSTNSRRADDKKNFTLLLKTIRAKLDARGTIDKKHYLLTIAGGSGSWYTNNVQLGLLHQYLDYANVMTYDIHGTWDKYTDFNAPLYKSTDTSPQYKWSVNDSINTWINAGFPRKKIVMGVPFYGYLYQNVKNRNNGLYQTFSGGKSVSFADIQSKYLNKNGYVRRYHKQSQVPWLFNGSSFISYDDATSMAKKASFAKSKYLGGVAIWELSQDPNKILLNSLYNQLK